MMACIRRCLRTHYPQMGYFATALALAGIIAFLLTPGVREAGLLSSVVAIGIAEIIGVSAASTVLAAFLGCAIGCF